MTANRAQMVCASPKMALPGFSCLAICASLLLPSCGTSSMATLMTTSRQEESGFSTDILKIDGKYVSRSGASVRPGRHVVEVLGTSRSVGANSGVPAGLRLIPVVAAGATVAGWASATESQPIEVCFRALAGRDYEVRTFVEGGVWHVEVIDQTTTYDVKSPCKHPPAAEPALR